MEKPVAALELSSKSIKLVIGYVLDDKVNVIYTTNHPYGSLIANGNILDKYSLINAIKSITNIADAQAKLKINIADAIVCLPPSGLKVFITDQMTSVISEDKTVGVMDVRTLFGNIRASCHFEEGNSLVDIIPNKYELDHGSSYLYPPYGAQSESLRVHVTVHSLPTRIVKDYSDVIHNAGVTIRRLVVAPQAAVEILSTMPDIPKEYFLVDIGSDVTTVTLVSGNNIYSSRSTNWGGDNITERIVESLNINESDAEKYKNLYGYDYRDYSFDPIICSSNDGTGNFIDHKLSELKAAIKIELDALVTNINGSIETINTEKDMPKLNKLPLVLIGGGASLFGLKEFLLPKVSTDVILLPIPNVLGARNSSYFNCLGMIMSNHKHPFVYDDNHQKVESLTRNK